MMIQLLNKIQSPKRQASPIERLKVNLYDDEKSQQNQVHFASINNVMYNGADTPLNGNYQSLNAQLNNQQNKKPAFRRRHSCYCNQTGKQSEKAQKIDFLITTSFIKNRIFQRMKKKQDMKLKNMNEKDLIIQNLNRTFDMQERNSARSAINSPSYLQNLQYNFNSLDQTPQTNKIIVSSPKSKKQNIQVQQQQVSKSQFSHINSPQDGKKQLSANKLETQEQENKNTENINNETSSPIIFNKRSMSKKQTFSQTIEQLQDDQIIKTPLINVSQKKEEKIRSNNKQKSYISNVSSHRGKGEHQLTLSLTITKKNHSSSKNSPRNSVGGTASPRKSQNALKSNLFFNNQNISTSFFNTYLSAGKGFKEDQQDGTYLQQYQSLYPAFNERRKKLLAKLRIASKLVGIQEKQRKKSLLFDQDYYSAMQEIANNVAEQDHQIEQDENNAENEEKKTKLVKKIKNDQKKQHSQFMVHQIIDSHGLRFNTTLNSFIDSRSKSYNTLISPSANTMSSIQNFQQQKKKKQVSPFNHDVYLQPLPVLPFPSPNNGSSVSKRIIEKSPLLLFQTQQSNNKSHDFKMFNEKGKSKSKKNNTSRQINISIDMNHQKNSKSMMGFTQSKLTIVSNSQPSLEDIQADQNKQSFRIIPNYGGMQNPQQPQKSLNEIQSLEQLGKFETLNSKNMKSSRTTTNFKPQTKTQQKFESLLNNQVIAKNPYFFKSPNPIKNTQQQSINKSVNNQNQFNIRNNSQPDLFQLTQFDNKHNASIASSNLTQHKSIQSQRSNRPNYLQAKFESKTRKSIQQGIIS